MAETKKELTATQKKRQRMSERLTTCPSCGRLYADHPGLIPTCLELQRMKDDMDDGRKKFEALEVRASNARVSALEEAARIAEGMSEPCVAAAIRKAATK